MTTSVEDLLAAVARTPHDGISDQARVAARRQVMDGLGVAVAAASEDGGRVLASVAEGLGGAGQAAVVGTGVRATVTDAAWAVGSLAHLLDYDDTGFSHPTACIMPAALAVGEMLDAAGEEFLDAMVVGYEVFERLALAARDHEPVLRARGLHPTSMWGCPAAAAAAGRLLNLDQSAMIVAFGVAASAASGLTQQFGTWAKGLNAGNAARTGVTAALLAAAGYRADAHGISGQYGLMSALVGDGMYDWSASGGAVGVKWAVVDPGIAVKPFPACTSTLRVIDAVLEIADDPEYEAEAVTSIVLHVHPDLLHTLRYRAPSYGFNGKFSLEYTAAAAALDRDVTIDTFNDALADRPAFRHMLGLVELNLHHEWPMTQRYRNRVEIALKNGRILTASVAHHRGSPARPLTDDEVASKFIANASRTLPREQADEALTTLLSLPGTRVAEMVATLVRRA